MLYPRVRLVLADGDVARVGVSPSTAAALRLAPADRGWLAFGQQRREVTLVGSAEVPRGVCEISSNLAADLRIPEGLPWELVWRDGVLKIGPVVGLLSTHTTEELDPATLIQLKERLVAYPRIRGAVIVFAADQVWREDGLVDGYLWDERAAGWRRWELPLPSAVYRTVSLAPRDRDRLASLLGSSFFNDVHPDREELYRWLSTERDLRPHLLEQSPWSGASDLVSMEPGSQRLVRPMAETEVGRSVLIARRSAGWQWWWRDGRLWTAGRGDSEALGAFVHTHLGGRRCVQQEWPFAMREGERWTDYHLHLQKDLTSHWQMVGMIARRSSPDAPLANLACGGMASQADDVLKASLGLDHPALYLLKQRMTEVAVTIGEHLDRCGLHLGDMAVDLALDLDRNIWIHSVNARVPDPSIGQDVDDPMMYYALLTNPLYYARALAGFPAEPD